MAGRMMWNSDNVKKKKKKEKKKNANVERKKESFDLVSGCRRGQVSKNVKWIETNESISLTICLSG